MVYKQPTPAMVGRAALPAASVESMIDTPLHGTVFRFALALIFLRFSMLHQIQAMTMGVNLYLLYLVGIPAVLGILITGGIPRTFRRRPAIYWSLFAVCLSISMFFSSWRGGSIPIVINYFRTDLLMIFIVAGAALTWRDCRRVMLVIAGAAVVSLAAARLFGRVDQNERMMFTFGTVSNSNDYAAHLILVLPFLLWVVLTSKVFVLRVAAFCALPFGLYVILATGSRGALVAIGVGLLFALFMASGSQRALILVTTPVMILIAISFVPQQAWQRLLSLSHKAGASEEALESSDERQYLLRKSLEFTFEHPVFGVGAGQFFDVEGTSSRAQGQRGSWHEAHNTYTQISSENGLPAFFFFAAGIGSSMVLLIRVYRAAKNRPEFREISATAFCLMLSLVGFCTAIFFLNFGYFFYLPAMAGLAISVSSAAEVEFKKAEVSAMASSSQPNLASNTWLPQRLGPRLPVSPRPMPLGPQMRPR